MAWVLWDQALTMRCTPANRMSGSISQTCMGTMPTTPQQNWQYVETFDTRDACTTASAQVEAQHPKADFPVTGGLLVTKHTYVCLPVGLHPKDTY